MRVVGRVVAKAFDIDALDNLENLRQGRALTPGLAREDAVVFVANADRLLDIGLETSHVFHRQPAAVLGVVVRESRRQITSVEGIACCFEAGLPAFARMRFFLIAHVLQAAREIRLNEEFASTWRAPVREIDLRV